MRNWKFVRLLKQARKTIARDFDHYMDQRFYPSPYICDNINKASETLWPNSNDYDAADRLTALIDARLDGYRGLQWWLHKQGHMTFDQMMSVPVTPALFNKLQATRLAWIDDLIKEFS